MLFNIGIAVAFITLMLMERTEGLLIQRVFQAICVQPTCIVLYIFIYVKFARLRSPEERVNNELEAVRRNTLLFFGCIILYLAA